MNAFVETKINLVDINFALESTYWNNGRDRNPSAMNVRTALNILESISNIDDVFLKDKVLSIIQKFNKDNKNRYPSPDCESRLLLIDIFLKWVIPEELLQTFIDLNLISQPLHNSTKFVDHFFQYRDLFSLIEDLLSLRTIIARGERLMEEWDTQGRTKNFVRFDTEA